jgi:hypothetical protein
MDGVDLQSSQVSLNVFSFLLAYPCGLLGDCPVLPSLSSLTLTTAYPMDRTTDGSSAHPPLTLWLLPRHQLTFG